MAHPGFPVGEGREPHTGGGVDSRGGYVSKILYVKMKESGPLGGMCRPHPLDSTPPTLLCIHQAFKTILSLVLSKIFLKYTIHFIKYVIYLAAFVGAVLTVIPRMETYLEVNYYKNSAVDDEDNTTRVECAGACISNRSHLPEVTFSPNESNALDFNKSNALGLKTTWNSYHTTNDDVTDFIVSISVIFCASMSSTIQSLIVAGSSLKDLNYNVLSFWYFALRTIASIILTFSLEQPLIPQRLYGVILCFGHSLGAFSCTYFDVIALQLIDVNVNVKHLKTANGVNSAGDFTGGCNSCETCLPTGDWNCCECDYNCGNACV